MAVERINSLGSLNTIAPLSFETDKIKSGQKTETSFSEYLKSAIEKVDRLQTDAEKIADEFAAGRTDNIHDVMIAAAKADLSLQFTLQIRNKILDAYNEIMRMQI